MKKLKLKENEVVHCATLEEAKKVLKIAHELGLSWRGGELYIKNDQWNDEKENTVYYLNKGTYGNIKVTLSDYTVITSKEFIKRHKKASLKKRVKALEAIVNGNNDSVSIIKIRELQYPKGWYKSVVNNNKAFIYFNGYDFLYGINYNGVWENESFVQEDRKLKAIDEGVVVKATHGEVVQRLIGEATKRGFNINCEINCKNGQNFPAILNEFEYVEEENKLLYSGIKIMKDGIWESCKPYEKEIQQPQIGDVVKAWDDDKSKFVYGVYYKQGYQIFLVGELYYLNIEKVTEISINDFKK